MTKKMLLAPALALLAILAFGGVASAEYGGPTTVTVVQGETINVTGDGCNPGATVTFTITAGAYSAEVGSTTAGTDGSYNTTITIPKDTPVGPATATATCEGPDGVVTKVLGLNVTAAATETVPTGTLPRTGSSSTQTLVGVGAGLLLLGGALAVGARRTRKPTIAA